MESHVVELTPQDASQELMKMEHTGRTDHHHEGGESATDEDREIQDLREAIVDLMHTEMEYIERIKQSEDSIVTVNGRVDTYKALVKREKARSSELQIELKQTVEQLQSLAAKKLVVEERTRQAEYTADRQHAQATDMATRCSDTRTRVRALERSIVAAQDSTSRALSSRQNLSEELGSTKEHISNGVVELLDLYSHLQVSRRRIKSVLEYIAEIQDEAKQLHLSDTKLKAELNDAVRELRQLSISIEATQLDAAAKCERIQKRISELEKQNNSTRKKLKLKQKKYRIRMKGEIVTLRKRVSFLATEEELLRMSIEEIMSSCFPMVEQRISLETRKDALNEEILTIESLILQCRDRIDALRSGNEEFDTSSMKQDLHRRNLILENEIRSIQSLRRQLYLLQSESRKYVEQTQICSDEIRRLQTDQINTDLEIAGRDRDSLVRQIDELQFEKLQLEKQYEDLIQRKHVECQKLNALRKSASLTAVRLKEAQAAATKNETQLADAYSTLDLIAHVELIASTLNNGLSEDRESLEEEYFKLMKKLEEEEQQWK